MRGLRNITNLAIEAVVDDGALQEMCKALRTTFGATHHLLVEQSGDPIQSRILDTTFSEQAIQNYVEHYSTVDLWAIEFMHRPRSSAVLSEDLVPQKVLRNSEICEDFINCHVDRVEHLLAVAETAGPSRFLSLSLLRSNTQGPFDAHQKLQLDRLAPTLRRLIRARATLREIMAENTLGFRGLDALARPILIVNAAARVEFANQAARSRARRSNGISLWTGNGARLGDLGVWFGDDRNQLALAIRAVAGGETPSRQIALKADSTGGPCVVEVLHIRDPSQRAERNYAMLVIHQQERRGPPSAELLMQVFGLTAAEAKLAIAIAAGVRAQDFAQQHQISLETVRSQMKSTFSKLGVNRQAELVRAVLALAA